MVEFLSVQNCNNLRNTKFEFAYFRFNFFSKTYELKVFKQFLILVVRDFHSRKIIFEIARAFFVLFLNPREK